MRSFLGASAALLLAGAAHAKLVEYTLNATWVIANPDGAYNRPTLVCDPLHLWSRRPSSSLTPSQGINGQWPLPTIEVDKGDQLLVHFNNHLGNQSSSLHFHGLYQNGTTHVCLAQSCSTDTAWNHG